MKENSPDFSQKDLVDLQKSPVGRQLYEKLRSADPATLEKAMEEAQQGGLRRHAGHPVATAFQKRGLSHGRAG